MACSKSFQRSEDFFSNVLDIVCDRILEHLPICIAAQTSVLSKQWRRAWLSLKKLNFDADFWGAVVRRSDWQKCSCIISSVLFHHNGPVHDFHLYIPRNTNWDGRNLSQWICFLSKNGVQKIVITNHYAVVGFVDISSYIFRCSELVYLELINGFYLNSPPTDFTGFPMLKHLLLENIMFRNQNNFITLIGSCKMLVTLKLVDWLGMDHVVIDAPSLQTLILEGDFQSLAFRNVRSLESISLHLNTIREKLQTAKVVNAVNLLASSCQLQSMEFNGLLCKFLAGVGIMNSTSVTFKHLHKLCLSNLNLNDFSVFRYLLSVIDCCPYIKTLDISLISASKNQINPGENVGQRGFDFNYNYKLHHLREVNIKSIMGSTAELKFVEYLFAISVVLENVFFKAGEPGVESELKISKALMALPRASPKARLFSKRNWFGADDEIWL
ncbi:F-box/FBD/LRR-repeat protein At1g13570-like [Silene latifolia]|uniref:F-box/FBD/LRR-repeat protein At1g13570-like n=1 Tax=Silene latifolia TaxID=37657 RepID=UPI003D78661B